MRLLLHFVLIIGWLVPAKVYAASNAPVGAEHGMVHTAQQHATRVFDDNVDAVI